MGVPGFRGLEVSKRVLQRAQTGLLQISAYLGFFQPCHTPLPVATTVKQICKDNCRTIRTSSKKKPQRHYDVRRIEAIPRDSENRCRAPHAR